MEPFFNTLKKLKKDVYLLQVAPVMAIFQS